MTSGLDQRSGWPDELKVLLAHFPRNTWRSAGSPMAQFWLDRHGEFRHHATALQAMATDYRNERKSIAELTSWTGPRLQGFLAALHGHHQIEDFHYFPAFRESHKTLAAGFDVLARDHELLHNGIIEIVEAFNALLAIAHSKDSAKRDAHKRPVERYLGLADIMFRRLRRHLDDEEDLIIPIMLEGRHS